MLCFQKVDVGGAGRSLTDLLGFAIRNQHRLYIRISYDSFFKMLLRYVALLSVQFLLCFASLQYASQERPEKQPNLGSSFQINARVAKFNDRRYKNLVSTS
jgi:hypothetical protein